jgi:hypothetical protein
MAIEEAGYGTIFEYLSDCATKKRSDRENSEIVEFLIL